MSVRVIAWAWDQPVDNQSDLLVLLALADHADNDGTCWPGAAHVARKARLDERTVPRCIRRLEKAGLVEVEHRPGRCNLYHLKVARAAASTPGTVPGVEAGESPERSDSTPGAMESGVTPGAGPGGSQPTPDSRSQGTPGAMESGEPSRTVNQPSARAREGVAAPTGATPSARETVSGGDGGADDRGHRLAEAIAVFKTLRPAMIEAVGEDWKIIGPTLFVIGASPGHMLFGQISDVLVDVTLRHRAALERVTGCEVKVIKRLRPDPGEMRKTWKGAAA